MIHPKLQPQQNSDYIDIFPVYSIFRLFTEKCLNLESLLKSLEFLFLIKYASWYSNKVNLVFLSSDFGPQRAALDLASEWMSHHVELRPHRIVTGDRIGGRAAVGGQSADDRLAPYVHGG